MSTPPNPETHKLDIIYKDANGEPLQGDFKVKENVLYAIDVERADFAKAGITHLIMQDGFGFGMDGLDHISLDPKELSTLDPAHLQAAQKTMAQLSLFLEIANVHPKLEPVDPGQPLNTSIQVSGDAITGAKRPAGR